MNVMNILLTFVVLIIVGVLIKYVIEKNKNAEVEEGIDIDDKTYTIEKMKEFVKKRLDEITKINLYDIGLSEEELKRRKAKKYELKRALKGCTYGDVNDKKYVKELIFDLLAKEYGVTEIYSQLLIHPADANNKILPRRIIVNSKADGKLMQVPETVIETLGSRDFDGDHLILLAPDMVTQDVLKIYTHHVLA